MALLKKNISTVLIAAVALSVMAAVAAIVVYISQSSNKMASELGQQSMQQVSRGAQSALNVYVNHSKTLVHTLAAQKAIVEAFEGDPGRARERLQNYIEANKDYWAIFLFDSQGVILAGYNAKGADLTGQSRADRDYVKAILSGQDS